MCGIVACISNEECSNILYNGLIQLKNRGYDSAGICTANNENQEQKFIIDKYASTGNIDAYQKLQDNLINHEKSHIGIAHTRWATHGAKSDINSHPHVSMCGKFALVHNGIIENYKKLKNMLLENDYLFKSQTDSEVIVQLLSFLYMKNKNVMNSLKEMIFLLEGTYGLAILCSDEPNSIYCIRHGSPLLIGYDDNSAIVVSEISGFCNKIQNYFVLKNLDICKIKKTDKGIEIQTNNNYEINNLINTSYQLSPAPYPHWTIKEIYEQTESCLRAISMGGRLLDNNQVKLGGLEEHLEELMKIDNLILLGCGTSYFAGQHGLYFLKELCHFNTIQLFDGADFDEKDIPKYGKSALLLISQSGETKDLYRCVEIGKQNNLFLIGLVNVVDSLIAREVNCGCYLNAGREVGVASTKAYTSQVILLAMISIWFSQKKNINEQKRKNYIKDIRQLHFDIQNTLNMSDEKVEKLAEIFYNCEHCFLLGKGKSESVAKEGALKIKEITYIHSEGYSTSSLKHGPFSLLDDKFPVIILAPNDLTYKKSENAYEEIKSRHAPILFITDNVEVNDKENIIYVPENNTFRDLLCVIPLQLLAYNLALKKGINPDTPKNLAKVVSVE